MCALEASSAESASLTSASPSPASSTHGSARPTPGDGKSSTCAGPECRCTRTCERSIALALASIFSSEASPAEGRARPATDRAWTIQKLLSGGRWPESLASFDPDTSCWRTSRISLLSDEGPLGERFLGTWPRSGMSVLGTVYPLPPLAPLTDAIGSLPLLPTPMARAQSGTEVSGKSRTGGPMLGEALLPTPTSHERTHTPRPVDHGRQLANEIALLPTPHGMAKDGQRRRPGPSGNELGVALRHRDGASTPEPSTDGKKSPAPLLNPSFVAWMLGAPADWCDPSSLLTATEYRSMRAASSENNSSSTSQPPRKDP